MRRPGPVRLGQWPSYADLESALEKSGYRRGLESPMRHPNGMVFLAQRGRKAIVKEWINGAWVDFEEWVESQDPAENGATRTIVLAWTTEDFRVVGEARIDMGERPKLEAFQAPHAAIWLLRGTAADFQKAKTYAGKETDYKVTVFAYPTSEADPIARAKRDVLDAPARKRKR